MGFFNACQSTFEILIFYILINFVSKDHRKKFSQKATIQITGLKKMTLSSYDPQFGQALRSNLKK